VNKKEVKGTNILYHILYKKSSTKKDQVLLPGLYYLHFDFNPEHSISMELPVPQREYYSGRMIG
jgi:hypothetical protein